MISVERVDPSDKKAAVGVKVSCDKEHVSLFMFSESFVIVPLIGSTIYLNIEHASSVSDLFARLVAGPMADGVELMDDKSPATLGIRNARWRIDTRWRASARGEIASMPLETAPEMIEAIALCQAMFALKGE